MLSIIKQFIVTRKLFFTAVFLALATPVVYGSFCISIMGGSCGESVYAFSFFDDAILAIGDVITNPLHLFDSPLGIFENFFLIFILAVFPILSGVFVLLAKIIIFYVILLSYNSLLKEKSTGRLFLSFVFSLFLLSHIIGYAYFESSAEHSTLRGLKESRVTSNLSQDIMKNAPVGSNVSNLRKYLTNGNFDFYKYTVVHNYFLPEMLLVEFGFCPPPGGGSPDRPNYFPAGYVLCSGTGKRPHAPLSSDGYVEIYDAKSLSTVSLIFFKDDLIIKYLDGHNVREENKLYDLMIKN